jgi:alpha 1,2-mannosyltransferase
MEKYPRFINKDSAIKFVTEDGGKTYNNCHCEHELSNSRPLLTPHMVVWSNFEIADLDFWRSEAYMKYFEYLDSKGGFYYEVSTRVLFAPSTFPPHLLYLLMVID